MKTKDDEKWIAVAHDWGAKLHVRVSGQPPPPVFCGKSLELLDSKGVGYFDDDKEFVTVSNDDG